MSREIRRVPLGWKHPTTHNPHWLIQSLPMPGHTPTPSRLHSQTDRFVGLRADYPASFAQWELDLVDIKAHRGFDWEFHLEYNLTGYKGHADAAAAAHLFFLSDADEDAGQGVMVRDEAHLEELLTAKHAGERPDPADYMPVFDQSALGWCLYETLTEGTPTTPVFATAEELIEHLVTVGEDRIEEPYRREAAERIVTDGYTAGTAFQIEDGPVVDSAREADKWPTAAATS